MTISLTTGWCAHFLNDQYGSMVYSSAFILSEHRAGNLVAKEIKGNRRRAYVRILPGDFRAYLLKNHPQHVSAFDALFHLQQRAS